MVGLVKFVLKVYHYTKCMDKHKEIRSIMKHKDKKAIYIVISSNDTLIGKLIRKRGQLRFWNRYEGDCYGHVSLSLDADLSNMMSFARKKINNPLISGLIYEDIRGGIFARNGEKGRIAVIKLQISEEKYEMAKMLMETYWGRRDELRYNFAGLFFMLLTGRGIRKENQYICSHWVGEVLAKSKVYHFRDKNVWELRPLDYYDIFREHIVYEGLTMSYK